MAIVTPMLRQYQELKQQHPGTLLFFRLGDFYELFFDDAITGARELEITLTARHRERGAPIPMCGVPYHAASTYIAKLVRKGFRVAVCEQTEDPAQAKKLVRREVIRVITPGTAVDPQLLESKEVVYLAAVSGSGIAFGAAFLDLSTGEFRTTQAFGSDAWDRICADLESYRPREILVSRLLAQQIAGLLAGSTPSATQSLPLSEIRDADAEKLPGGPTNRSQDPGNPASLEASVTELDESYWDVSSCAALLRDHFRATDLAVFGLAGKDEAVRSAGACLRYAQETQRVSAAHVSDLEYFEARDFLMLDSHTVRNLELTNPAGDRGTSGVRSLFGVVDETVTGMGARILRSWLLRPSIKRGEIEARLSAVDDLRTSQITRDSIRSSLKKVSDIERLVGRLNLGTATPRDIGALRNSLGEVPGIHLTLSDAASALLQILHDNLDDLTDVHVLVTTALTDDPPARLSDRGVIREGFSAELDELRAVSSDAKGTIARFEALERKRTGISNLRIGFNSVFGYYIEISRANATRAPVDYERRQTLANAERFITPELKRWEERVLSADDRIGALEARLFNEICEKIRNETGRLQTTARVLATLDAVSALAETATRRNYVRPQVHDGDEIEVVGGRHPVVEASIASPFVPNDVFMNNSTDRLLIITGPNMGGKSTFLRQTALISIMAQMGSFVPADRARLPVLDRIWTRVGASDDLAQGRSTFMVEMTETATILHNATPRSLVLLDELGRGTSTFDGLAIAWAVTEFLHDSPSHSAKTLFATHYHELTELAEQMPGARNYRITVAERDGEVVFLHRIERGRAGKSYGIDVARLAGIPASVLERAREVLRRLERFEVDITRDDNGAERPSAQDNAIEGAAPALGKAVRTARRRQLATQITLFDAANRSLLDELRNIEVETLTPDEARKFLRDIQERIV